MLQIRTDNPEYVRLLVNNGLIEDKPDFIMPQGYIGIMFFAPTDEYGYKEKLKIVYDEDFRRPDLVISNQQFSYNNKLYQLLVIDQPMY